MDVKIHGLSVMVNDLVTSLRKMYNILMHIHEYCIEVKIFNDLIEIDIF